MENKASKIPFPAQDKAAPNIHAAGLSKGIGISLIPGGGVADGTDGDVIVITPAYNITKVDAELIVERAAKAVEQVLGPTSPAKLQTCR